MPEPTKLRPTYTFAQDKLAALKAIAPEAFADGALNLDVLREALGEHLEDEGVPAEHFGLSWPGKRAARRLAAQPSAGTLAPASGQGVNEADTRHLYIEGDNLEVLKLLQKSYAGRVKLIYIDPPYNTGNDFVYNDDFTDPLEDYLRKTGQADEAGALLTSNPKASGRFHSNWLNMIYPRLLLARPLLREDGVIFVSIDDNEVHHLRQVMDEVFGAENFVATVIWQKKQSPQRDATYFSATHDYILVFAKQTLVNKSDYAGWRLIQPSRTIEQLARYKNPDDDPRGAWASTDCTINKTADERPNLFYSIRNPNTHEEVFPPKQRTWSFERQKMEELIRESKLWWGSQGANFPRLKSFLTDVQDGVVPTTIWEREDYGDNQESAREVQSLFSDSYGIFSTPKPSRLITR